MRSNMVSSISSNAFSMESNRHSERPNPTCAVTGATGAVGPAVLAALQGAGYRLRVLSRTVPPATPIGEDVMVCRGDVADADAVRELVEGAEVVVHLASKLHVVNPSPAVSEEYHRVNVLGTETVVRAATEACVHRVVVVSSIAVYGATSGLVTEDSPPAPNTLYGETKLEAERLTHEFTRADGTPLCTVLRPAAVYGPGLKGNYLRLVQALANKRFVPIGNGTTRRPLIYDNDLAAAIVLAASHSAAAGRTYNVADGVPHQLDAIVSAICIALGRSSPRFSIPTPIARSASAVVDRALALGRRRPRFRGLVDKYLESLEVDAARIERELGFVPRITLEAGWEQTVQALRRRGALPPRVA